MRLWAAALALRLLQQPASPFAGPRPAPGHRRRVVNTAIAKAAGEKKATPKAPSASKATSKATPKAHKATLEATPKATPKAPKATALKAAPKTPKATPKATAEATSETLKATLKSTAKTPKATAKAPTALPTATAKAPKAPKAPPEAPPEAPSSKTTQFAPPADWTDLSGDGGCVKRVLCDGAAGGLKPRDGAICQVKWTAWLARRTAGWWTRGDRVGIMQPNATMEFTLGGGSGEATKSWDLAVETMVPGERCEIVASAEYAFGKAGYEPHIPPGARMVFELELLDWEDWARGRELVIGLDKVDDEAFSTDTLRDEILNKRDRGERTLMDDDLDERDAAAKAQLKDSAEKKALKDATLPPTPPAPAAELRGKGDGYSWQESQTHVDVTFHVGEVDEDMRARDVEIKFRANRLEVTWHKAKVFDGALHGEIVPADSTWAVSEDARGLEICLEKRPPFDRAPSMEDVWGAVFADGAPVMLRPPKIVRLYDSD
ncbi:hypothetical protein M885DRAFT_618046 [Pelagophyceae sp. CCMP2097]|nr:hypothetical protein M885DRAFT_618046 [Pelagophyceae sp. CCMP2097]